MKLIKVLRGFDSRSHKEQTLVYADDLDKKTLRYAYDQLKTYGLKFKDSEIQEPLGEPIPDMFELLDKLANRELTGNAARQEVEEFARHEGSLIKLVCNRDLDCGVTATTINKVFPGLIPQFKLQLAKEVPLDELKFPMYGQLKYDGVRIAILAYDGKVEFRTRNGKFIHLPNLAKSFSWIEREWGPTMLDTEVVLDTNRMEDRTKISGMINSARNGNSIAESDLIFYAFDYLSYYDFISQKCSQPYNTRLGFVDAICSGKTNIKPAETKPIMNADEANEYFQSVLAQGQEGIILKPLMHQYTYKRSKDWVKLKAINTADLKCVNYEEGTGKYQGMIGALICEGEVEGKQITVRVGSGLTDADRSDRPSEFMGHTIEIKYNTVIQDSVTKEWSLFLPRFVQVRLDK